MRRTASTWAAGAVWLLTALCLTSAFASESGDDSLAALAAYVLFVASFATVGAVVAALRPRNPLGWIMCWIGLAYALAGAGVSHSESAPAGGDDALVAAAAWAANWGWVAGLAPSVTFLLLLFPTGRPPSPRWRPVARLAGVALGLLLGGLALSPDTGGDTGNPVGVEGGQVAALVGGLLLAPVAIASVASLLLRFRAASPQERRQLKWLTYTAAVAGCVVLSLAVVESFRQVGDEVGNALVSAAVATLPISMGVAILRRGLFDIDVVIRRTLVYGVLTALLAGAYLLTVLLLGLALSPLTEQSDLAIAGSTLAVAALFRPLRARVQAAVDRRFYRRRYDAARTLEGFGARMRDELDLEALAAELRRVASETMQPTHLSLWLR